jgi:hypothetical protein
MRKDAVVGECTCGCSSLRLSTPAAPLPVARTIQLSDTGRADYLAVSSGGRGPDGHVSVVLHVVEGRLYELEIFAGEGTAVDPASVTALTGPRSVGGSPDIGAPAWAALETLPGPSTSVPQYDVLSACYSMGCTAVQWGARQSSTATPAGPACLLRAAAPTSARPSKLATQS